ncbi:MAG: c-type cytochrome domain-containing protein, partial [Bacteroidota bacterium]
MKSNGVLYGLVSSLLLLLGGCATEERISFNADIRPILNANCVNCHGGVKQSGGFGLVFRENALGEMSSGAHAIVPGKPGKSELVRRLRHENPELRMPYEGPPLPEEEIALLEKWIAQGAEWETHWAYAPVREVRPPEIDTAWGNNEIDR